MFRYNLHKCIASLTILLSANSPLLAQTPDTLWTFQKPGAYFTAIEATDDGGWVAAGLFYDEENSVSLPIIIRIDSSGAELWSHTYVIEDSLPAYIRDICPTEDGGWVAGGELRNSDYSRHSFWLIGVDAEGNENWTHHYREYDYLQIGSLQTLGDGWVFVGYGRQDPESGDYSGIVSKTDQDGHEEWTRQYGGDAESPLYFRDIAISNDSEVMLVGRWGNHPFIMQVDQQGDSLWSQNPDTMEGTFRTILSISDGQWVIGGDNYSDALILKYDNSWNEVWSSSFGNIDTTESIRKLRATSYGSYIAAGLKSWQDSENNSDSRGLILEIADDGTVLWNSTIGTERNLILDIGVDGNAGTLIALYPGAGLMLFPQGKERPFIRVEAEDNKHITLAWNSLITKVAAKYKIYRSEDNFNYTLVDSLEGSPPDTTYTDSNLVNGVSYYYRITAIYSDQSESPASNTVFATPQIPVLFTVNTDGVIAGGVTMADGSFYAASSGDGVYRFDNNGTVEYSLSVDGNIMSSTTITPNHTVYITSTNSNLYSFNSSGLSNSGWPLSLGAQATASVAIDFDNTAYIGTSNGIFQAVDQDGIVKWGYNCGSAIYSSAAITEDNLLIVISEEGRLLSFDLNTLDPASVSYKTRYEIGAGVVSSPALDGLDHIYITTSAGDLLKLRMNESDFEEVWRFETGNEIVSSPIISSSHDIYFGGLDSSVYAVDSTGQLKWQTRTDGPIVGTVALAETGTQNDRLYTGVLYGRMIYALSLEDGTLKWKYKADTTSTIIQCPMMFADGVVYFGTSNGDIIAIEDHDVSESLGKTSSVTPVWPTFQGNNARTGNPSMNSTIPAISTVYPGDADNDGDVDANDVLPIAVYFLETGESRSTESYSWSGHEVNSWSSYPANYADCNGDGIVDERDVIAIGVNWGSTHENGLTKFRVDPENRHRMEKHLPAIKTLYGALAESDALSSVEMKRLLEKILGQLPTNYTLYRNYPNPFNPDTQIKFSMPAEGRVDIKVFDLKGQLVETLLDQELYSGGYHSVTFHGASHSSGVYFCKMRVNGHDFVQKMLLVK